MQAAVDQSLMEKAKRPSYHSTKGHTVFISRRPMWNKSFDSALENFLAYYIIDYGGKSHNGI